MMSEEELVVLDKTIESHAISFVELFALRYVSRKIKGLVDHYLTRLLGENFFNAFLTQDSNILLIPENAEAFFLKVLQVINDPQRMFVLLAAFRTYFTYQFGVTNQNLYYAPYGLSPNKKNVFRILASDFTNRIRPTFEDLPGLFKTIDEICGIDKKAVKESVSTTCLPQLFSQSPQQRRFYINFNYLGLEGADLSNRSFFGCSLRGTFFSGSNLCEAVFRYADFEHNYPPPNFGGPGENRANISGANFSHARLYLEALLRVEPLALFTRFNNVTWLDEKMYDALIDHLVDRDDFFTHSNLVFTLNVEKWKLSPKRMVNKVTEQLFEKLKERALLSLADLLERKVVDAGELWDMVHAKGNLFSRGQDVFPRVVDIFIKAGFTVPALPVSARFHPA